MTRWQTLDRHCTCSMPWTGLVRRCSRCGALWIRGRWPTWLHRIIVRLVP